MIEEYAVDCPHCGETITLLLDLSDGDQRYTEDCSVCCAPWVSAVASCSLAFLARHCCWASLAPSWARCSGCGWAWGWCSW